jgi:hypothetical protein
VPGSGERTTRIVLVAVAFVTLLVVLAVMRAAYDDGPTPQERRCQQLRASANAVPGREDTTQDELEYLRRAEAAEKACAEVE